MVISFNQIGSFQGPNNTSILNNPTSLQFGPDGRLYVSEQNGMVNAFTVALDSGAYVATSAEEIDLVKQIQNHNDDGSDNDVETNRQVTGLLATGTAANPVLYVSSSDPRIANNGDINIDTNSGVITRLTWNGTEWEAVDIIRGLPRSEENHATNGLVLSADGTKLYVAQGGNTNNGAPSSFFSYTGEYALSGTVLEVDLEALDTLPVLTDPNGGQDGAARAYIYDLPTLDDISVDNTVNNSRENLAGLDTDGPWGGNDGLNMSILPADAPLRIYADGLRNHYDLVLTQAGKLYTVDNGSNGNLGGDPVIDGVTGEVTNQPNNGGSGDPEPVFLIEEGGYYGHPAPVRANQDLAWTAYNNSGNPDSSVSPNSVDDLSAQVPNGVDIQEGFLIDPSKFTGDSSRLAQSGVRVERDSAQSNALITIGSSSNGLVEYTADAFDGELKGDLLVAQFNNNVGRINLSADGTAASYETIPGLSGFSGPLDVTVGPDGTVWVAEIGGNNIKVFAPSDLVLPDDPDFDNDGIDNVADPFIRDATNGGSARLFSGQSLVWDFDPNQDDNLPGPNGYGGGLTGVMINGETDYEQFFQEDSDLPGQDVKLDNVKFITAAGGGTIVVENVSNGDPFSTGNNGEYLFHTGVTVDPTVEAFTIKWSVFNPAAELTGDFQQIGGYIGTGDQSNFLKIVAIQHGSGEIQLALEQNDTVSESFIQADDLFDVASLPDSSKIFFELAIDPMAEIATPTVTYETNSGDKTVTGAAVSLSGTAVLDAIKGDYAVSGQTSGLAVGLFSTNNGESPADTFQAIFDEIEITAEENGNSTVIYRVNAGGAEIAAIDGGPNWAADTGTFLANVGSNGTAGFNVSPGGTVAPTTPADIFQTERWDAAGGSEMQWAFDNLDPGTYEVRLFMGNGFSGTSGVGARVFDVAIEGSVPSNLDDVDLVARFGHLTGGMVSNTVEVTDGTLNIDFLHDAAENPLINGIEIVRIGETIPTPTVSIISGDQMVGETGSVQVSLAANVTVPNDETVTVNFEILPGSATPQTDYTFSGGSFDAQTGVYTGSVAIAGGSSDATFSIDIVEDDVFEGDETFTVNITGVSANAQVGTASATVTIADDDISAPGDVLYRVNAGGAEVAANDGGPAWSADQSAVSANGAAQTGEPSPYLVDRGVAGDDITFGSNNPTGPGNNTTSAPDELFLTERYSTLAAPNNLGYAFDVPDGEYTVNLYFDELFFSAADERIFDVEIEGALALDDFDTYGTYQSDSGVQSFSTTVTDGVLNVEFLKGVANNPHVAAIEIVAQDGTTYTPPLDDLFGVAVEISGDRLSPTDAGLLSEGSNLVTATQEGEDGENEVRDRDIFTVTIPDGFALTGIELVDFENDNPVLPQGFFGLQLGNQLTVDLETGQPDAGTDGLLGGVIYNSGNIGQDLLEIMSQGGEIQPGSGITLDPFTPSLTGEVTVWLNQGAGPGTPTLNFIVEEIAPEPDNVVVAINSGGPTLTQNGIEFVADSFFSGGTTFTDGGAGNGVQPLFDGTIYKTERYGGGGTVASFSYSIPVIDGNYDVELHFAEIFLPNGAGSGIGGRIFDVEVEGQLVIDDLDILATTGGDINQPVVIQLSESVSPDDFGNLDAIDISFSASADNAKVSGIVIREAEPDPEPTGGEAVVSVTINSDDVQASNFGSNAFLVNNTGTKKIARVEVDVTNALYPDSVFDPFGVAGDTISKALTIDTNGGTGVASPDSNTYIGAGGADGFKAIQVLFDESVDGGFEPGETLGFSVDMDPNSIAGAVKGILDSGAEPAWDIGGISGAELIGSVITITFDDGTTATGQLQGANNQAGAQTLVSQDLADVPVSLSVNNLSAGAVGSYNSDPSVIVSGPAGQTARIVLTKGFIQPGSNNFSEPYKSQLDAQLDALAASDFPANNAVEFQTVDVLLTGEAQDISALFNFSEVPVAGVANPDQLPLGFVASVIDPDNNDLPIGPVSSPIYLQYEEIVLPVATLSLSTNAGAEADATEVTVTVSLSEAVVGDQSVDLSLSGLDVTPEDFVGAIPSTLTIAEGETIASFTLTINDDDVVEGLETATFTISNPSAGIALGETVSGNVVISDNDAPAPVPEVSLSFNADSDNINASTFTSGSIAITNQSTENLQVDKVIINLSEAILPNIAFDPAGTAGDAVAKGLVIDSGGAATGFVTPANNTVDPFSDPVGNGGFYEVELNFTNFEPGETVTFSVDIDPTSIEGDTGSGAAGSVAGVELINSTATVHFNDGSILTGDFFTDGSVGGSEALVSATSAAPLTVEVLNVALAADGNGLFDQSAVVDSETQTVKVTGEPGQTVKLFRMEASGEPGSNNGVPVTTLQPFEANAAVQGASQVAVLDANGEATFQVLLTNTAALSEDIRGVNIFVAAPVDGNEVVAGPVTEPIALTYQPDRITDDLLALYTFDEGSGSTVNDVSGVGGALNLTIDDLTGVTWGTDGTLTLDDSTLISSGGAATKLIDGLTGGDITLEAWLTPENITQSGPARIATLSGDFKNRNFTLGQQGDEYDARLRTTSTSSNGTPSASSGDGTATTDLTHVVYTRASSGAEAFFVNGQLVSTDNKGGNFSNWNDSYQFALGNEFGSDRGWLGSLDLVAVYAQTFDEAEAMQNFLAGSSALPPTPNTPPVVNGESFITAEDLVLTGNVLDNDSDADGDGLTAAIALLPGNGVVDLLSDGSFTYTPNADFNGEDSFTYEVSDGNRGTNTATATVTVDPVNDNPIAVDDEGVVSTNGTLDIDVAANDSDVDGNLDPTSAVVTVDPSSGTVVNNGDGTFTYTPEAGFVGADSFTYAIADTDSATATATVAITVTPTNDAPVAQSDTVTTDEDTAVVFDVAANDTDADGNLAPESAVVLTGPTNGTVMNNGDGTFSYTPNADFNGEDSFTYQISDALGATDEATVNITVSPVNDGPVALADTVSTAAGEAVTFNVLTNDTDVDGDTLTLESFSFDASASGTLTDEGNGTFTYTPAADFSGDETFAYTISDGNGGIDTAAVTIEVASANSRVTEDLLALYTFDEGSGNTVNDVSGVGNALNLTIDDLAGVTWGDGILTLDDPTLISSGVAATKLTNGLTDGNLTLEAWLTPENKTIGGPARIATLSGNKRNRNFTLGQQKGTYDVRVRTTDTNDNGTPSLSSGGGSLQTELTHLVYTRDDSGSESIYLDGELVTSGTRGGNFSNWNSSYQFALGNEFGDSRGWLGSLDLVAIYGQSFDASEVMQNFAAGSGTLPPFPNTPPTALNESFITAEDMAVSGNVLGNDSDADGDSLSASVAVVPNSGLVALLADGSFVYTPDENFNGEDSFTYEVSDGKGGVATATTTITVTAVSDDPVAIADVVSVQEGASVTFNVLTNDSDPDGDTVTLESFSFDAGTANGTLVDEGNGTFTYTPNAGFSGEEIFSYTISDGNGGTDTAAVTIQVSSEPVRVTADLLALYTFDEGSGNTVNDVSGVGNALDLTIDDITGVTWGDGTLTLNDPTLIASGTAATKLVDGLTGGNITLEAWLTPENTAQSGPARIATLSSNSKNRNSTLGQQGDEYDVRLRTTATNNNGTPSASSGDGTATTDLTHVIYTRSDSGAEAFFLNGELVSTDSKGGDFSNWNDGYQFALGNEFGSSRGWLGSLDLVAVYAQTFDETEAMQNFLAGADVGL